MKHKNNKYFVVFCYLKNDEKGLGNTEYLFRKPIDDINDVREIEGAIQIANRYDEVAILNYQKM